MEDIAQKVRQTRQNVLQEFSAIDKCLIIVLFMYPLYKDTWGSSPVLWGLSMACGAILLLRCFRLNIRIEASKLVWLAFGVMAVITYFAVGKGQAMTPKSLISLVEFVLLGVVLILSPGTYCWLLKLLRLMLIPHAVCTLVFMVSPSLYYATVFNWFFSNIANSPDFDPTTLGYESGLTSHYSFNGMLLAAGLLVSVAIALASFSKTEACQNNKNGEIKEIVSSGICIVIFVFALVATAKRGPFIFALIAICIVFLEVKTNNRLPKLITIVLFGALFVTAFVALEQVIPQIGELFNRFSTYSSGDINEVGSDRGYLWNQAIVLWEQNPIFGNGVGTFRYQWSAFHTTIYAHNVYLGLLAETGIVGLVAYLYALISVMKGLISSVRHLDRLDGRWSTPIIFATLFVIYYATYSFVGAPNYDVENYAIFYIYVCSVWYSLKASINNFGLVNAKNHPCKD